MFDFIKKHKKKTSSNSAADQDSALSDQISSISETIQQEPSASKKPSADKEPSENNEASANTDSPVSLFSRLKQRLGKTRENLAGGIQSLLQGHNTLDDELLEEIETQLIMADIGIEATNILITGLRKKNQQNPSQSPSEVFDLLNESMTEMLQPVSQPLDIPDTAHPYMILMAGINGAGKTTTIGKLAQRFQAQGLSVMLAAGDTFRAAAVEQLQEWGKRINVPVIAQHTGADSASVIYDAFAAAKARNIDVIIADTAGRLHTQDNLMEELSKIKRVAAKLDENAPHEVMLVLDSGTGQNALNQAKEFNKTIGVTGITLTKLDGTAKGGIIFAIANSLQIPVRFIGVGESAKDLREFHAEEFVSALLDRSE